MANTKIVSQLRLTPREDRELAEALRKLDSVYVSVEKRFREAIVQDDHSRTIKKFDEMLRKIARQGRALARIRFKRGTVGRSRWEDR